MLQITCLNEEENIPLKSQNHLYKAWTVHHINSMYYKELSDAQSFIDSWD